MGSHAAVAAEFLGQAKVEAAIHGRDAASVLDEKERALMQLAAVAGATGSKPSRVQSAAEIQRAIADCRRAGWSAAAVYHAITVIALFNFYNAWVDAAGVEPLTPEGYAQSGERLHQRGYCIGAEIAGAGK